jgi:sugar lactone lactonase YvrE
MRHAAAVALALTVGACYDVKYPADPGAYACNVQRPECPPGYACIGNRCVKGGDARLDLKPVDARRDAPDASPPDARPPDGRRTDTKPDGRPPDTRPPDVRPPDAKSPDLPPSDAGCTGCLIAGNCIPSPCVMTLAGTGVNDFNDGLASQATFSYPIGVAVDTAGKVYVADIDNFAVRWIAGGMVGTLAGGLKKKGYADGPLTTAKFDSPAALTFDAAGALLVGDSGNKVIRKIDLTAATMTVTTVTPALLNTTRGVAVDSAGNIIASSHDHVIWRIDPKSGNSTIVAGIQGGYGFNDGPALSAKFYYPNNVVVAKTGEIYVADGKNNRIRTIATNGVVSTLTGSGAAGNADGAAAIASFNAPTGLALYGKGLLVADLWNNRIRHVNLADGSVTSFAGTGQATSVDGPASLATFDHPFSCTVDAAGTVYVAESGANRIRVIK